MNKPTFTLQRGSAPLVISIPHCGTVIPPELQPLYTERALKVEAEVRHALGRQWNQLAALSSRLSRIRRAFARSLN